LIADEGTKFLFDVQQTNQNQQQFKGFQPGASSEQPGAGSEVDFSKMTYEQLTAYMEANPNAQI